MSLDWDISNCEDWEALKTEEQWPITEAVIWHSIMIDMGEITKANWAEFADRIAVQEMISGSMLVNPQGDMPIARADVRRRIGLRTNVTTLSRSKWLKRIEERLFRNAVKRQPERQPQPTEEKA